MQSPAKEASLQRYRCVIALVEGAWGVGEARVEDKKRSAVKARKAIVAVEMYGKHKDVERYETRVVRF